MAPMQRRPSMESCTQSEATRRQVCRVSLPGEGLHRASIELARRAVARRLVGKRGVQCGSGHVGDP